MTNNSPNQSGVDLRNTGICIGLVLLTMLVVWPFGDMPYADDFAYADVALKLAQTGHFHYNSWEFAMLVEHGFWGALFIRLFGFSFTCVRLSTVPFALGAEALTYLLLRKAGLTPSNALLAALVSGLSPLFVPLSVTYMTDVPCLFFTLASVYAFARAAQESNSFGGYQWLLLGALAGFIGGTGRQVVWLVPMSVLPCLAWARRHQQRFVFASGTLWILVTIGVTAVTAWFNRQLYVAQQPSVVNEIRLAMKRPLWEANIASRLALMLFLMVLPAALPVVIRAAIDTWRGPRSRRAIVGVLLFALFSAIAVHPSLASIPWINSTLNWQGINGDAPLHGRPIVLTTPIRAVAALVVYISVCLLAAELVKLRWLARRAWNFLVNPTDGNVHLAIMTVFSVTYFVLLIIRGVEIDIFDRYLLPIMPSAEAILLLWFQTGNRESQTVQRIAKPVAWVALGLLATYAFASTQDLWSLARARVVAAKRLVEAGIPRTAIDAGLEYNGWTQLMTTGQMNDRWVKNPPGAYRQEFGTTPDVIPIYRLEYEATPETTPSEFGKVPYYSLLPPFRKQVRIDRIVGR